MKTILLWLVIAVPYNLGAQILTYSGFRTPSDVDAAYNTLAGTYPSLVTIQTIGLSVNGAPIKAIRISNSPTNNPSKGDVVFMALMHAREWITVETLLYITDRMLAEYSSNQQLKRDIDNLQIWIIPVCNPDGYSYTATTDRYWRKNRKDNGDGTFGVDLNRNWGYQWGLLSGSSNTTADDTYHGTSAFSEAETQVIHSFIDGLQNFKTAVSYHSFSELYLRPWAYTTADPPGESTLRSIAQRNISRIQSVHGITYAEDIWYTSSGEAGDYLWNQHRSASFAPELRPGSGGLTGFSPPATEILPCAEEQYPAALALLHDAALPTIWVRDNSSDTGIEPSTGYTWESPDIWTVPGVLNQGATVALKVHVNNSSGAALNNVTVEAYYTDPRITLEFPSLTSILIGQQTVTVPSGGIDVTFTWVTPTGTNIWGERHWCVGAVVKHDQDMPLTTVVNRSSNIACHNFNTTEILDNGILQFAATNFLAVPAELRIVINKKELPSDWVLEMPETNKIQRELKLSSGTLRKSKLLKAEGVVLEPGQTIKIPIKVHFKKISREGVLVRVQGELLPLIAGKRTPVGNGYTYKVGLKKSP